jgi:hypothetical protein
MHVIVAAQIAAAPCLIQVVNADLPGKDNPERFRGVRWQADNSAQLAHLRRFPTSDFPRSWSTRRTSKQSEKVAACPEQHEQMPDEVSIP